MEPLYFSILQERTLERSILSLGGDLTGHTISAMTHRDSVTMRLYTLVALSVISTSAFAHSFLTFPMPISKIETCRIGGNRGFEAECGGPCPNYAFREDMRPENPAAVYARGERIQIHWSKNNHRDGFMRLALVPLDEMFNKEVHARYAFYFGCWTDQEYSCNEFEHHRDCYYDRQNLAYKTQVTIPPVYPDGVYVLGWTWYGGGEGYGSFGDYYDCSYVEISGGAPLEEHYDAAFEAIGGRCLAAVDRLGLCATEPCRGEHWSRWRIPQEFRNGAPRIESSWAVEAMAREANKVKPARPEHFGVTGFSIIDAQREQVMDVKQDWVIRLDWHTKISIVPHVFGDVTAIEWIVNGDKYANSHSYPWSISGEQPDGRGGWNYFDWNYPIFDKRMYITAIAWSGQERAYFSKDLVFRPTM